MTAETRSTISDKLPNIGHNPFFIEQSQRLMKFWPQDFSFVNLVSQIRANWIMREQGYRPGVVRVQILPDGYKTRVVVLQEGDKLEGSYKARVKGEVPRKQIGVVRTLDNLPEARMVEVVLYHRDVLAENNEACSGCEWDIITILAHPTHESAPMNVGTLMANHFGMNGGTKTLMSPEDFQEALRVSQLYWADKAMAELPED
jgi:hypothetical protein